MSEPTREQDEYIWVKRVPVIDEAMIERAAKELRKIMVGYIKVGHEAIAERVLRAALEVSDE